MAPAPTPGPKGNPLKRKLGPLPAWAWALALVGAFVIYRRVRSVRSDAGAGNTFLPNVSAAPAQTPQVPPAGAGDDAGGIATQAFLDQLRGQGVVIDQLTGALISTPATVATPTSAGGTQEASAPAATTTTTTYQAPVDSGGGYVPQGSPPTVFPTSRPATNPVPGAPPTAV